MSRKQLWRWKRLAFNKNGRMSACVWNCYLGFWKKMLKMFQIWETWEKIVLYLKKMFKNNFPIFKNGIHLQKHYGIYVYTVLSRYLEKWSSFDILKVEATTFKLFQGIFVGFFSIFTFWPFLGWSKNDLEIFFTFLTKNWPKNMHYTIQTRNFQLDLSLTSWSWLTLTLNMLTESLGWC